MALISCKQCNETVSTEAVDCPYCGTPQQTVVVLTAVPVESTEEIFFSDNSVIVTNVRLVVGGATYALRNITSVKMLFTPPRLIKPILLLIVGLMILFAAFMPINEKAPAPAGVYVIAGIMILGAILWMCRAKTKFHVGLSSTSGEVHALTSNDKAYIELVLLRINEAIAKYQ